EIGDQFPFPRNVAVKEICDAGNRKEGQRQGVAERERTEDRDQKEDGQNQPGNREFVGQIHATGNLS
ncbi:MAG: hypothetical protein ACJASX_004363, partial [Limisphaerales bacterium]